MRRICTTATDRKCSVSIVREPSPASVRTDTRLMLLPTPVKVCEATNGLIIRFAPGHALMEVVFLQSTAVKTSEILASASFQRFSRFEYHNINYRPNLE